MSLHMETLPDFSVISGETSPLSDGGHSSRPSQHSGISGEPIAKRWSSNPITMLTHILKPSHLGFNGQESCSPILSPICASKIFRIQDETLPNCTGESLFEDTIDPCFLPMVEPTVGSSTMALSHTPPETCISMRESFTKPEDANKDLQRGSNFSLSLQGSPTALRETISTSSCSRASLEGTHDTSAFEGSKESLHSLEHKVQNLTTEVAVSVVVQKSSVASSWLSNANVAQIICPDSEKSASYTVPLSSSTSGSLCDDKMVNNEPNVTTTALEAVEISRPMKDTFEACHPMKFNATTEQETYDGTKQPLNNTFQTNPHVNATTEPVTIVGNARPHFQTDHEPTKSAEVDVREHMVQSQPGPSGRDSDPFTLDDTLELSPNFLLTSTPMVTSTALRKPERPSDVRKKLSSGILPKPAKPPAVSKLATYRKSFLQPQGVTSNPKSVPPPLRSVSQLPSWTRPPKTKTAPVASAPSEPSSAIPSRRCKTQADASGHAVVTVSQQASTDDPSSSRRSTIAESKLMRTGLRKPQSYGTRRSIASLGHPAVRAMATRSTENPSLSSGLNGRSLQAPNQGQKHLPTSSDAFPVAKRKKIGEVKKPTTFTTKLPKNKANCQTGCANYVLLQQELETCRQENERLQAGCANYVLLQQELETCRQENERLRAGCANYVLLQQELETCRQENERLQAGCANYVLLQQELETCRQENERLRAELRNRDGMDL